MRYHLTRSSCNMKTGPIPVSTTTADSCPPSCPLRDNGCYGNGGKLSIHWRRVSERYGLTFGAFLAAVRGLPAGQVWRHNQAGDLPGTGERIDRTALRALQAAAAHTRGWTYTHKLPWYGGNAAALREANANTAGGLTVNLSADSLEEADRLADAGCGPVVVVLPRSAGKIGYTPAGQRVVTCPAQTGTVTCATCGAGMPLCARRDRRYIIGFRAHGRGARKAEAVMAR